MTGTGSALADALNDVFGLHLADSTDARKWLRAGGFDRLDAWLATRPGDEDDDAGEAPAA